MRRCPVIRLVGLRSLSFCAPAPETPLARSWKGNLHTHSFWSDGDDCAEMIIDWYKTAGYDFVALSEHRTLAEGERFIGVAENGGQELLDVYKARFPDWVEERRTDEGVHEVRLETLEEYLDQAEGEPVSATGNFFAVN